MKAKLEKSGKRRLFALLFLAGVVLAAALIGRFLPLRRALPGYRLPARGEGELRLHFLDVGQGDCTMAEFPDGEVLVIDAGDGSFSEKTKLVRYLKGLHPTSVSMLLTHADSDHYGGFEALLESFSAEKFYLPLLSSPADSYQSLLKKIESEGCETATPTKYSTINFSCGAQAVCLSPHAEGETDENESSTVLYLEYGGVRALFSGDVSSARERKLLQEYALDHAIFEDGFSVDLEGLEILKIAHHGSVYSTCEEWLGLLRPETAILTSGENSYGHPSGEVIERLKGAGAEIFRTDELGDLIVTVKDGDYTVERRET